MILVAEIEARQAGNAAIGSLGPEMDAIRLAAQIAAVSSRVPWIAAPLMGVIRRDTWSAAGSLAALIGPGDSLGAWSAGSSLGVWIGAGSLAALISASTLVAKINARQAGNARRQIRSEVSNARSYFRRDERCGRLADVPRDPHIDHRCECRVTDRILRGRHGFTQKLRRLGWARDRDIDRSISLALPPGRCGAAAAIGRARQGLKVRAGFGLIPIGPEA